VYGTLDEKMIKWDIWTFPSNPVSIVGSTSVTTNESVFTVALADGNIFEMNPELTDDDGEAIDSYIMTGAKFLQPGRFHHFAGIKLDITGNGDLKITTAGKDGLHSVTHRELELSTSPGVSPERNMSFLNALMTIKLRVNEFGEHYTIKGISTWVKATYLRGG
jgi:hypothetical protein